MTMTDTQVRQGHPQSFGFMRRPECDAVASRIAGVKVDAWEAPDGQILVWLSVVTPVVARSSTANKGFGPYRYTAMAPP